MSTKIDMQLIEIAFLICLALIIVLALVLAKEVMELAIMMQGNKKYKKVVAELKKLKKRKKELIEALKAAKPIVIEGDSVDANKKRSNS